MTQIKHIGAVVIGRNEGARLVTCLASLGAVKTVVYVDSGSTDTSLASATSAGAEIVKLDTKLPFTAARARNAGLERLAQIGTFDAVQFVDGDCENQPDWIPTARTFLDGHPDVAVVCGRRRERFPRATLYNFLADVEWNTPLGETRSCGGDALMRMQPLSDVGGYNPDMIAGEEPELCVRLRQAGHKIWRLDAEMTLHDANLTRFGQWLRRTRRAGHAFAQGAHIHGAPPECHNVPQMRRALIWGLGIPLATIIFGLVTPWGWLLLLAWPLQTLRLKLRGMAWRQAVFVTLGKIPEAQGVVEFHANRLRRKPSRLIEYK
jgi:GT2 family glycosyltransferase